MYGDQIWYKSRAVWGGIIAILAGVAGAFGYAVDESAQAGMTEAALAMAGAIGGILAVVGRVKATKRIGK